MREEKRLNLSSDKKKLNLGRDLREKEVDTMTKRELYNAIMNGNEITEEMRETCATLIEGLDHTNELRKASAAKKAVEKEAERAPIRQAILAVLTDEPKTATTLIAEAGVEIKPQSIPSLLRAAVENGEIVKSQVKVTGKGKQVGYARA